MVQDVSTSLYHTVISAKVGIHACRASEPAIWMPAFAGMTVGAQSNTSVYSCPEVLKAGASVVWAFQAWWTPTFEVAAP